MNKYIFKLLLLTIIVAALLLTGCGPADDTPPADDPVVDDPVDEPVDAEEEADEPEAPDEEAVFTLEELAEFDGQDGRPAYIAVDGVVYDVSNVPVWGSGSHYGFEAGIDATEALQSAAPHGVAQLNQAEVVGTLAD